MSITMKQKNEEEGAKEKLRKEKEALKKILQPDDEMKQKLIDEAREVLFHSDRLTDEEKESGIEKLQRSIGYEEAKSYPESIEELPPILVKIVVVPEKDHIYYEPRNIVSKSVKRNQQIVYWCEFPFTIHFGGHSIITDSPVASASSAKIWLQSEPKKNGVHMIDNAWIRQNALSGKYKYSVAVAVPPDAYKGEHWKVIVDDPEDVVRDPDKR